MVVRRLITLALVGALHVAFHRSSAQQPAATVVGVVTTKTTGEPVPYADVTAEPANAMTFTDQRGAFRFAGIAPGELHLRVRRLGFRPSTVTIVAPPGADTVRVVLSELALQLERVRVVDAVCPGSGAADTSVLAILEQVQINAGRSALLAREYPFQMHSERTYADEVRDGPAMSRVRRHSIIHVDTVVVAGEHQWQYEPGRLVSPTLANSPVGATEQMTVPDLADFAGEPFIATHCFRYAGQETIDDMKVIRVDFEPVKAFRSTDVRGSLYLDAHSYAIHRSTLLLEVSSPLAPDRERWDVRVDTWFHDILGGVSTVDRVAAMTTVRSVTTGLRLSNVAATEEQRMFNLRFLGRQPGVPDPSDRSHEALAVALRELLRPQDCRIQRAL